MEQSPVSARVEAAYADTTGVGEFLETSAYSRVWGRENIADFVLGNPQEPALPGMIAAMRDQLEPRDKNWYAYTLSVPGAASTVAARPRRDRGLPYEAADIAMTPGAFGAIAAALLVTLDHGDEALYQTPPWFSYHSMITATGGRPIGVPLQPATFDLDLDRIAAAITERTRLVIVNTPQNPTGRVYPPQLLADLADVLTDAGQRHGRPTWLLSDEPYHQIVFDGIAFHSPADFYPYTLVSYSYGKVLLAPGQRLGWLAVTLAMPERRHVQELITAAQISGGWLFPTALMQYAVPALETESIDIDHLQRKRDRMVSALRAIGYEVQRPQGTFYLLPRNPIPDDHAFTAMLAAHDVYVLPGALCEIPGYFRVSLTATDEMVEMSLAGFAAAFDEATARPATAGS